MSFPKKIKPENVVNAYLFYSQRLLNLLNSTSSNQSKIDKISLEAAICLSLKQTWESWLQELSEYVGHSIPEHAAIFLPKNSMYPEIEYLVDLSKQKNNWLSKLSTYFEPKLTAPTSPVSADEDSEFEAQEPAKRINLVQVVEPSDSVQKKLDNTTDAQQFALIIKEFKAYIDAVRSRQAEW